MVFLDNFHLSPQIYLRIRGKRVGTNGRKESRIEHFFKGDQTGPQEVVAAGTDAHLDLLLRQFFNLLVGDMNTVNEEGLLSQYAEPVEVINSSTIIDIWKNRIVPAFSFFQKFSEGTAFLPEKLNFSS